MSIEVVFVDRPPMPLPDSVVVEYDSKVDKYLGVPGWSSFEISKPPVGIWPESLGETVRVVHKSADGKITWKYDFTLEGLDAFRAALNVKFDSFDYDCDYCDNCGECIGYGECDVGQCPNKPEPNGCTG